MKKIAMVFFGILLLMPVMVSAGDYMRTGKKLSLVTIKAIEKLPKTDLSTGVEIPEDRQVSADKVVEVSDMAKFCTDQSINSQNCQKFGFAFTLSFKADGEDVAKPHFPIYINTDARTKSEFETYDYWYRSGASTPIVYMLAGALYHEGFHAGFGENSEAFAYERELKLLSLFDSQNKFAGATWFPILLEGIQKNLEFARKTNAGAIKVGTAAEALAKNR